MRSNADDSKNRSKSWKLIAFAVVIFVIFVMFFLLPFIARLQQHFVPQPPKLPPPDLSRCTRLEIQYYPSLDYLFSSAEVQGLLSPAERQYLESLKTIVVENQEHLKAFAHDVSLGSYEGPALGKIPMKPTVDVVCYHSGERLTSFTIFGRLIETENGQRFAYDRSLKILQRFAPQIWTFYLRADCSRNLVKLRSHFSTYLDAYPVPTEWCDATVQALRAGHIGEEHTRKIFKCPGVLEGKCHYAMNPNCKPNSPPDMVLLFETKAGWNQHGGPELFTFDNHDPKGGCVLLNDGTVKFIRTPEELQQLRWK